MNIRFNLKKILHVISSTDPALGGPIEGIRQLANAVEAEGFEVEVLSSDDPKAPWLPSLGLRVHALGPGYGKYAYNSRLKQWLHQNWHSYSAVIVNGIWQYHSLAVASVAREKKLQYYVFTHGMLDPWFAKRFPLKHIKKKIYWYLFEERCLREAVGVMFTSLDEHELASVWFAPPLSSGVLTGYGIAGAPDVPFTEKTFIDSYPILKDKRFVLFLSRIHPKKGCDLAIAAFAQISRRDPDLFLVIAGPDESRIGPALRRLAASYGVEQKIVWTGPLRGAEKWGAFNACEVFFLPSHSENFGIVVAEALACGKLVAITKKVNIWREIVDARAGWAGSDDDAGALESLTRCLEMVSKDPHGSKERARSCFLRNFSSMAAAKGFLAALSLKEPNLWN